MHSDHPKGSMPTIRDHLTNSPDGSARSPTFATDQIRLEGLSAIRGSCSLPETCESIAKHVAARTAIAQSQLLQEVRQILARLSPDRPIAEDGHGIAAALVARLNRVDRLARELCAYSETQVLVAEAVELLPLLSSMAHILRHTLDRSVVVTVHVDRNCPPCYVDVCALDAALINLVVNAHEAMPSGGRLQLMARYAEHANGRPEVELTVADSGIGMAPAIAQQATFPFFTTRSNDSLAGLGLAAVKGFAKQSGGSLTLQTSTSYGTSVMLTLPAIDLACQADTRLKS